MGTGSDFTALDYARAYAAENEHIAPAYGALQLAHNPHDLWNTLRKDTRIAVLNRVGLDFNLHTERWADLAGTQRLAITAWLIAESGLLRDIGVDYLSQRV